MKVKVYYDGINYRIRRSADLMIMLEKVIREENKVPGDLNYIITTDEELVKINREFLGRDYYTDVISFDGTSCSETGGEIYISLDTVRRNSIEFNVSLEEELVRVMIHGLLHLCGYRDDNITEKKVMNSREEYYLRKIFDKWSSIIK